MTIEELVLNVCEALNAHTKKFKELSDTDTSKMSLSEKMEIHMSLYALHGAIVAYKHVLALYEDQTMEGGEE